MKNSKQEYYQKLKDPRWQIKRLEIMKRDGFMCRLCYDNKSTLNVHHCFYEYGNDPWDYPTESLLTLCEPCHKAETDTIKGAAYQLGIAFRRLGFTTRELVEVADASVHRSGGRGHAAFIAGILSFVLTDQAAFSAVNKMIFERGGFAKALGKEDAA